VLRRSEWPRNGLCQAYKRCQDPFINPIRHMIGVASQCHAQRSFHRVDGNRPAFGCQEQRVLTPFLGPSLCASGTLAGCVGLVGMVAPGLLGYSQPWAEFFNAFGVAGRLPQGCSRTPRRALSGLRRGRRPAPSAEPGPSAWIFRDCMRMRRPNRMAVAAVSLVRDGARFLRRIEELCCGRNRQQSGQSAGLDRRQSVLSDGPDRHQSGLSADLPGTQV
jgi:hypothetical protein